MREIDVVRPGEGEGGAAARLQAHGPHAAQFGGVVGPGAGGVHQHARPQRLAAGQRQGPGAVLERGGNEFGVVAQHRALARHAAQEALVQGMHVDIAGVRLLDSAAQLVRPQAGHARQRLFGVDQRDVGRLAAEFVVDLSQQILLVGRGDVQHAARAQQGMLAETLRRMFVEIAAGAGQRLDLGGAVGLHEHGGRAAGGVVAGLGFALQHHDGGGRAQAVGHGCAGDAGADDGVII